MYRVHGLLPLGLSVCLGRSSSAACDETSSRRLCAAARVLAGVPACKQSAGEVLHRHAVSLVAPQLAAT
jgi:hypothetical protein